MKSLVLLVTLLLVGTASAAPVNGCVMNVTEDFFRDTYVIYTSDTEITKIVVPTNEKKDTDVENVDFFVFFIEAGKGLSVLKDGKATLLLENGKDVAAVVNDKEFRVYLAATDGIYTFNQQTKTAEKFGTITDSIKNIGVTNVNHELYILTEDNVVYKVTEEGTTKAKIDNVKDAQLLVLDVSNNLYFVDSKNDVYVRSIADGKVKKFEGLPANPEPSVFFKPPTTLKEEVPYRAGDKIYILSHDGTSYFSGVILPAKLTAYSAEPTFAIFMGYDKKIYRYNKSDIDKLEKEAEEAQ